MPLVFKQRIPRYSKQLRQMAAFLNKHSRLRPNIEAYVYNIPILTEEQLDSYEGEEYCEHDSLFGVYLPEFGHILLAVADLDATLAQAILAHEYCHAIQHLTGKPFKEAESDSHALWALINFQTDGIYL